ncbi:hypothetical protein HDU84_004477 [Entophlyctis sp. JEL0112]|nr:hypothetical protein HDU84_004477 [Entophlyctis sp. JEL0112]
MSSSYASRLTEIKNRGRVGDREYCDIDAKIEQDVRKLADLIRASKHCIIHTGAGISTSAGIPDFRGPNGVWTLQKRNQPLPAQTTPLSQLQPTFTHRAITTLVRRGLAKHVVSQNVDNLHLRSGLPRTAISEVHGTLFAEWCDTCRREIRRVEEVQSMGLRATGNLCDVCGGNLRDMVCDWTSPLPDHELKRAMREHREADLVICAGSSLRVDPVGQFPKNLTRRRDKRYGKFEPGKIVIINLQRTTYDKYCALRIFGRVDDVFKRLLEILESDDEDDDFMVEDDEDEEFDFDYEDEDNDEPDVDLENKYYSAKGLKEEHPMDAINEFQTVVDAETEKGDWGFKSLKQICKVAFKLGRYDLVLKNYPLMLTYIKSAVARNYSEKSINNILDYVSGASDMKFLEQFYSLTLDCLNENKNERLWVKTNLKLAKLWLDRKEFPRFNKILRELRATCQTDDGSDDQKKGTLLLEIYALEIQMYTETKNNKKLKALYQQCLNVKSAIPHPKIMAGVIRECGGKMHMSESEWEKAQTDFFEAFKNYDEAGSGQRITCLKYLVLANMLMESQINPFDSQETKPYKNDADIVAMTNLLNAYQRKDIFEVEKILRENRATIMDDVFIRTYIDGVLKKIRTQVLVKLIKPYTRIEIPFISKQLNVPIQDVEDLLVGLILDKKINGKIDQVNLRLELFSKSPESEYCSSLTKWVESVESLYQTTAHKVI